MILNFPNPSRSFDTERNRVIFWGYANVIEISFFVEADALQKLCPDMENTESGFLKAFDAARKKIYLVAGQVYGRDRKGAFAHILKAEDF
jgi:hypothetical protein